MNAHTCQTAQASANYNSSVFSLSVEALIHGDPEGRVLIGTFGGLTTVTVSQVIKIALQNVDTSNVQQIALACAGLCGFSHGQAGCGRRNVGFSGGLALTAEHYLPLLCLCLRAAGHGHLV